MYIELLDSTLEFSAVLIEYAQMPLKVFADISSGTRGLKSVLSLYMYASGECSCDHVYLCRLAKAFVARHCNRYQNLKIKAHLFLQFL